jgi:PKHD-type hydroxylase
MIFLPALPLRNRNVSMIYYGTHFTAEECAKIRLSVDPKAWSEGEVGGQGKDGAPAVQRKARSVLEQNLKFDQATGSPLSKFLKIVCEINATAWHFDLSGFVFDDMPYYMRYSEGRDDHYDWHVDMGRLHTASRKLSFSLQLTDGAGYEGGDLEFYNTVVDKAVFRAVGTLVIFPSYWMHRVHSIARGQRDVVVGWVHGPSYR